MRSEDKHPVIEWGLGLCFSLGLSLGCATEDYSDVLLDFSDRSIPVEGIEQDGNTFIAKLSYRSDVALTEDKVDQDLANIFKLLAGRFSDSTDIRIEIYLDDELMVPIEAGTADLQRTFSASTGAPMILPSQMQKAATGTVSRTWTRWLFAGVFLYIAVGALLATSAIVLRRQIAKETSPPSVPGGLPRLVVLSKLGSRKTVDIPALPATIGRGQANTVVIDDDHMSRHHAEIATFEGGFRLNDLESRNAIYVNGKQVTQCTLHEGDEIRLGKTRMLFYA